MNDYIYLDHAAATPMDPTVADAMQPYLSERFYNPSALYSPARAVAKDVAAARATVAEQLGANSSEIIFTAGGTEANNLAIHGVMTEHTGKNMVTTAIEHDSVLNPAGNYDVRMVPLTEDGRVIVEKLHDVIDDNTVLVSIQYANNEIGTIQPLRDIAEVLKGIKQARREVGNQLPLYFHTDACQAPLYLDVHVSRLGVDLLTLNGGKMYGPKQSGILYVGRNVILKSLIQGGGQERNLRSGTENVAGIIGFSTALALAQRDRREESARLSDIRDYCMKQLEQKIPGLAITGSRKFRLPNNVHVTIEGADNERLLYGLDEACILAAAGSACSASDEEPSHVLTALGCNEAQARSSLRFSFGHSTTKESVDRLVTELAALVV